MVISEEKWIPPWRATGTQTPKRVRNLHLSPLGMTQAAVSRRVNRVLSRVRVPLRVAVCAIAATGCLAGQTAAYRWIKQLGGSGQETLAGIATDRQGNTYVAGS